MEKQQKQGEKKRGKTSVYVIDNDFKIIYSDSKMACGKPEDCNGKVCYEFINGEKEQCMLCPMRKENGGKSIVFHKQRQEWVSCVSNEIELPGIGKCSVVVCEDIEESRRDVLHNLIRKYDYDEKFGDGLYNKQVFFKAAEEFIGRADNQKEYCMLAIDIENLKLYNDWYGREMGDKLIKDISECLKELRQRQQMLTGYFGNDDFAVVMEYDKQKIEQLNSLIMELMKKGHDKMGFMPSVGVYIINDKRVSVFKMYDYAEFARALVKGNYGDRIKVFNTKMLEELESKYVMISDVRRALQENEFTFFLQPKCNMENGKIVGAEALVRWESREKGMISPGIFVPFLEKSGLIAELDAYVWKEVCKWLRKNIDHGIRNVPVSVNVSKVDMYSMDVPAYFCELVREYDIPPALIEIEITESVFTENHKFIEQVVENLRQSGFRILMDDFGSGYSSLNMLKDIEVDVLKIDMRFLDINEKNSNKGISILETVHNMARLMGTEVIAEGVETENQKDTLLEMGCAYAQGYYFYRPMPKRDFEGLIADGRNLDNKEVRDSRIERLVLKDLLSENMFSEVMLNNMLGPVAFYEVYKNQITLRRYNGMYAAFVGAVGEYSEEKADILQYLSERESRKLFRMFEEAHERRNEGAGCDVQRRLENGGEVWMKIRSFFLSEQNGRRIYYSSLRDVTEIYKKNEQLKYQNEMLQSLSSDMPGGYYRHKRQQDCEFLYISNRFLEMLGFTREEIQKEFDGRLINMVHPDDRDGIYQNIRSMNQTGGNSSIWYRIRSKNGYIQVADYNRLVKYRDEEFIQGIIIRDIHYQQYLNHGEAGSGEEETLKNAIEQNVLSMMPCGIFLAEAEGDYEFAYVSDSMLRLLGYSREAFREKFNNSALQMVYEADREQIGKETRQQVVNSNYTTCEYRVEMADGSLRWLYGQGILLTDGQGKRWFCVSIMDCDYIKLKLQETEWQQAKYKILAEIPGMFVYDYEPRSDYLTIEYTMPDGVIRIINIEHFVRDIELHQWLSQENIEEQKKVFLNDSDKPDSGTVDFRACVDGGTGMHWYRSYYKRLLDEDGELFRVVGRADNIDEELETVSQWKKQAMRDLKTKLLNNESAKEIISDAIVQFNGGTMLLIDLDDFKSINDTLGHLKGDEVLKNVAKALRTTFRKEDIVARFGGDEFLVYIPGLVNPDIIIFKAKEILTKIEEIVIEKDRNVECSIGVAVTENVDVAYDELVHNADVALYKAKENGKNQYSIFDLERKEE